MRRFKFNYTEARGFTFPLIPIILKNKVNKKQSGYIALVDSGAVFCVFHIDVAKALEINLSKIVDKVYFRGVGKTGKDFKGKLYILDLMVAQKGSSHEFECPVVFSNDISKDGHPLLGMGGFFSNFSKITFDSQSKKVILED